MPKVTTSLRLPLELKLFVDREASANGSSQNSEIIRAVRERMERLQKEMSAQAGE